MEDPESGQKNLHSSFAELIKKATERMDGIRVEDLNCGDILVVKTQNSTYVVKILDPQTRKVSVEGPKDSLPEPQEFCLQGSCFTEDSSLFGGWVIVGMRIHLTASLSYLLLSKTEIVYLNGSLLLGGEVR